LLPSFVTPPFYALDDHRFLPPSLLLPFLRLARKWREKSEKRTQRKRTVKGEFLKYIFLLENKTLGTFIEIKMNTGVGSPIWDK
jgi:hypothetical protein